MSDEQFRQMCNTFGFAPSRALREMMDAVAGQAVIAEREACAKVCETEFCGDDVSYYVATAIRARGRS